MKIKVFMQTGSSAAERNILLHAGAGLQKYLDLKYGVPNSETVRLGRWQKAFPFVEYEYGDSYSACDLAVMFGSWKPREKGHHVVRNSVASNAANFICIETALLGRKTSEENTHYRVGLNGFLCRDAYWPNYDEHVGSERLEGLGIQWDGWDNNSEGHILVALQLPADASLRGIDISQWAAETIRSIRTHTDRPIVVRSHPLVSDRGFTGYSSLISSVVCENIPGVTFSDGAKRSWAADLEGAYCTVTYTSGLAIDSVVAGVPTLACDPGNFAFDISSNFANQIESLKLADQKVIETWLRQLALYQWTVNEMADNAMWERYIEIAANKR